jgi:riboflavin kinase/FMN adenylyltransferase
VLEASLDEVRELEAPSFVRDVLIGELGAGIVVVGESFRFGHRRTGDVSTLARLLAPQGLELFVVPPVCVGNAPVSSTRIRSLLQSGDVAQATQLLSRPPILLGRVVPADGIGRTLGFPTANLALDPRVLLPRHGVYISRAFTGGARSLALTYVGSRPTLQGSPVRCEVHWLAAPPRSLTDETLEVHLLALLRRDTAFASLSDLRQQMDRDLETATRAADAYPDTSDPNPFGG